MADKELLGCYPVIGIRPTIDGRRARFRFYWGNFVQVQVLLPAPNQYNPNHVLVTSEWFGFTFYLNEIT